MTALGTAFLVVVGSLAVWKQAPISTSVIPTSPMARHEIMAEKDTKMEDGLNAFQIDSIKGMKVSTADLGLKVMAHPIQPSQTWGTLTDKPLPTGAWWLNLVLGPPVRAVAPQPYSVIPGDGGVQICYPKTKGLTKMYTTKIQQDFSAQLVVSTKNGIYQGIQIEEFDTLSVTVISKLDLGTYKSHLVRGSPYITVAFEDSDSSLTPSLWSYDEVKHLERGDNYIKLTYQTGEVWAVWSEPAINWKLTSKGDLKGNKAQLDGEKAGYEGVIRVAAVPDKSAFETLNKHWRRYPVSGRLGYTKNTNASSTTLTYEFEAKTLGKSSKSSYTMGSAYRLVPDAKKEANGEAKDDDTENELLMLAAEHHVDKLTGGRKGVPSSFDGVYEFMKGDMFGVLGDSWEMEVELPEANWGADNPIPSHLRPALLQSLKRDVYLLTDSWDVYNYTKQASRMARLALIADEMGESELLNHALGNLHESLIPWLTGSKPDNSLVYDRVWGGIVTSAGLLESSSDFGNGWYNDHHFQYGYMIYAAAVLLKYDYKNFNSEYGDVIRKIAADYANPHKSYTTDPSSGLNQNLAASNGGESMFPVARHKDFWDFHSWASGIFVMDDSKSQESSSEAVNAYYSIALLGKALKDESMEKWGRLLWTMEMEAAQRYWHMPSWSKVYPEKFKEYKMVGMVSATRAAYFTWFGDLPEYIHCVNMMPFTPATNKLLTKDYMKEEYQVLSKSLTRANPKIQDAWQSLIYMALAIIDPVQAFEKIQDVSMLDNGLSLTNALYFAATQPGGESIPAPKEKLDAASWQCQGAPLCAVDFKGTAWSCCANPGGCCTVNPIPCCHGIRSATSIATAGPTAKPTPNPTVPVVTPPPTPIPAVPGVPAGPAPAAPVPGAPVPPSF